MQHQGRFGQDFTYRPPEKDTHYMGMRVYPAGEYPRTPSPEPMSLCPPGPGHDENATTTSGKLKATSSTGVSSFPPNPPPNAPRAPAAMSTAPRAPAAMKTQANAKREREKAKKKLAEKLAKEKRAIEEKLEREKKELKRKENERKYGIPIQSCIEGYSMKDMKGYGRGGGGNKSYNYSVTSAVQNNENKRTSTNGNNNTSNRTNGDNGNISNKSRTNGQDNDKKRANPSTSNPPPAKRAKTLPAAAPEAPTYPTLNSISDLKETLAGSLIAVRDTMINHNLEKCMTSSAPVKDRIEAYQGAVKQRITKLQNKLDWYLQPERLSAILGCDSEEAKGTKHQRNVAGVGKTLKGSWLERRGM